MPRSNGKTPPKSDDLCLGNSCSSGFRGGQLELFREERGPSGWRSEGKGGGCPCPTFPVFSKKAVWLFSSRASQVTFRLRPKGSQGLAGWRAWAGPWLLLPLCPPAGFVHRLQLPLLCSFTQATSGPPLSHCLPREAPGGN